MKICARNPQHGIALCEGQRYTCEAGEYIEVSEDLGRRWLKQHPDLMEYGTVLPTPIEDEQPPVDPLTALEPSKPGSRGRGRPRVNLVPEEPAEEPEKPDTDAENDTLTALEEGTEE